MVEAETTTEASYAAKMSFSEGVGEYFDEAGQDRIDKDCALGLKAGLRYFYFYQYFFGVGIRNYHNWHNYHNYRNFQNFQNFHSFQNSDKSPRTYSQVLYTPAGSYEGLTQEELI